MESIQRTLHKANGQKDNVIMIMKIVTATTNIQENGGIKIRRMI